MDKEGMYIDVEVYYECYLAESVNDKVHCVANSNIYPTLGL